MNRAEHLLTCLAEECAEVSQRVSKALRFGLGEVQPGQEHTNAQRIVIEFIDMLGVVDMLQSEGIIDIQAFDAAAPGMIEAKRAKITKFMDISVAQGVLSGKGVPRDSGSRSQSRDANAARAVGRQSGGSEASASPNPNPET